jgi:hypothetical protein
MGVFCDLGRPVIGGWRGGPWISRDPVRETDLIWGGEFGQEGSVLFAVDAQSGQVVERHWIGAREFGVRVEESGRIWVYNYHGLNQPGNILQSWTPQSRTLVAHGFPPLSGQRFVSALLGPGGRLYLGTPVGRQRLVFDAHRIFDPETIVAAFAPARLVSFHLIPDAGDRVMENASFDEARRCDYGCGIFIFEATGTANMNQ